MNRNKKEVGDRLADTEGTASAWALCPTKPHWPGMQDSPGLERSRVSGLSEQGASLWARVTHKRLKESQLHLAVSLPLGLALGSPIFPSGCEGKLGVALESLQGLRDLT